MKKLFIILFLITSCSTISPSRRILKSGEIAIDLNVAKQFYGDKSMFMKRAEEVLGPDNKKWADWIVNPGIGASVGILDLFHAGLHIYPGPLLYNTLAIRPSVAANVFSLFNFELNGHYAPTIFIATSSQSKSAMMNVFGLTAALNLTLLRPYIVGEVGWDMLGNRFWNARGGASLTFIGWEIVAEYGVDIIGYKPNKDGTGNVYVLNLGLGYSF